MRLSLSSPSLTSLTLEESKYDQLLLKLQQNVASYSPSVINNLTVNIKSFLFIGFSIIKS
jgi:hypothetical protein